MSLTLTVTPNLSILARSGFASGFLLSVAACLPRYLHLSYQNGLVVDLLRTGLNSLVRFLLYRPFGPLFDICKFLTKL